MKNFSKITLSLILITILSLTLNAGSTNVNDSLPFLEVKGKIAKKAKTVSSGLYKVELIFKSVVIDSKFVDDEMPFSFKLPHNRDYTIKVYKKGYATKSVRINTGLSKYENSKGYYKYEFVVEMEEDITVKNSLTGINNSPATITGMDNQYIDFNHTRKYTKKVRPLPE